MTTKTLKRPLVGFYATSPRIADAYRIAVKHNKILRRLASIHELGHLTTVHEAVAHTQGLELVALSHADDDNLVLTDARIEPVVSAPSTCFSRSRPRTQTRLPSG